MSDRRCVSATFVYSDGRIERVAGYALSVEVDKAGAIRFADKPEGSSESVGVKVSVLVDDAAPTPEVAP